MNNNTWQVLRCVAGAWLLLAASHAWPVNCETDPSLTPTQREVCRQISKPAGTINAAFGANSIAFQQMSTQSDIRLNSVSATSMSRDVQCVVAGRNGAPTAGCPEAARVGGAPATHEATKPVGPFGVTVIGAWGAGKQDDGRDQTGFDSRLTGFTAIVDYRFAGNLLAGVSFGYQDTKLDFNLGSGTLETKANRGAVFASYVPVPNASLQGLVGFGAVSYDSNRACPACGSSNGPPGTQPTRNVASYDGRQMFASLGGSYVLPVAAWHLGGYARGDYVRASTDGYTETPLVRYISTQGTPVSNALQVGPQKATSLTSALGALASYSAVWGGVSVTPAARLEWGHEFEDNSRTISSRFIDADAVVSLPTASPVRDWAILGLSLRAGFTRWLGGFIDYSHLFKSDARYDVVSAGLRYEF